MRVEKISGKEERRILIGMIVDPIVCARIASKWQRGMFRSKWANTVAELCVSYERRYGKAPGRSIAGLFENWADKAKDKDTVQLAERFLSSLSDEYEAGREINAPYLIDLAADYFTKIRLKRLQEGVAGALDAGDIRRAHEHVTEYSPVQMGNKGHIDVLSDKEALKRAFAERAEPLIVLPGALGRFFGRSLQREGFISLLGPEKRGKTTWLVYLAWQAMKQRRRVAFFAVGDEGEEEMMLRFSVLAARRPLYEETLEIPKEFTRIKGKLDLVTETRGFKGNLTAREAYRAFKQVKKLKLRSATEFLRLSVHPNSSLSIGMMESQLQQWAREGYVPDVIAVDYMDILLDSGTDKDPRHRINQTWKDFRGLLQRWHALGLTATQANAASYEEEIITKKNFSESKTKLGHVTGMVGLNQTDPEKDKGMMRLNWVVGRGFYYSTTRCCRCAGAFALGNPAIRTRY
jgi:hypothetical protein